MTGWQGNGYSCQDVNECDTNNGGCSTSPMVPCLNTMGSFHCGQCPPGAVALSLSPLSLSLFPPVSLSHLSLSHLFLSLFSPLSLSPLYLFLSPYSLSLFSPVSLLSIPVSLSSQSLSLSPLNPCLSLLSIPVSLSFPSTPVSLSSLKLSLHWHVCVTVLPKQCYVHRTQWTYNTTQCT